MLKYKLLPTDVNTEVILKNIDSNKHNH